MTSVNTDFDRRMGSTQLDIHTGCDVNEFVWLNGNWNRNFRWNYDNALSRNSLRRSMVHQWTDLFEYFVTAKYCGGGNRRTRALCDRPNSLRLKRWAFLALLCQVQMSAGGISQVWLCLDNRKPAYNSLRLLRDIQIIRPRRYCRLHKHYYAKR